MICRHAGHPTYQVGAEKVGRCKPPEVREEADSSPLEKKFEILPQASKNTAVENNKGVLLGVCCCFVSVHTCMLS